MIIAVPYLVIATCLELQKEAWLLNNIFALNQDGYVSKDHFDSIIYSS